MGSENKNGKVPLISKIAYGFGDVGWKENIGQCAMYS